MASPKKPKLCFVLPEYSEKTHFRYVAEFARSLADEVDLFLVVEKGDRNIANAFPGKCYVQQFHLVPLRVLEHFCALAYARTQGYKKFYVHYSFVGAISAGILTKVLGGTVYYWNGGMPWLYARSKIRETFERFAYKLIDYLITGAHALVDGYSRFYSFPSDKIIPIHPWVHTHPELNHEFLHQVDQDISASQREHVLVYIHRLSRRKGAQHLPDIISNLEDQNTILVVVGEGPEREFLESEFASRGVSHRVRMVGVKPESYVNALLKRADIFLLPSEEEGASNSLIEAMVAGVPPVMFDIPALREITPKICHEYVVPMHNTKAFAGAVDRLIEDKESRIRIKKEIREWAQQFNLIARMTKFKEIILGI